MDGLTCNVFGEIKQLTGESISYDLADVNLPRTPPDSPRRPQAKNLDISFLGDVSRQTPTSGDYSDDELCRYIYMVLATFLEEDKIPLILNKKTVKLWKQAMTHVTYDPETNYDALEAVGDKILSYTFKTYLYQRFPDITAEQLNNLDQHYMSTNMQSAVSERMGLPNWLRVAGDVPSTSEKIREDLMESFFGVIDTIFIDSYGLGFGAKVCMKFMKKLFDDVDLNLDIQIPKTFVQQLFRRLNIEFVNSEPMNNSQSTFSTSQPPTGVGYTTRIMIGTDALQAFRNYGKDIGQTSIMFEETRMTKKPSEFAGFSQAMYHLLSYGITARWAQGIKNREMIDDDRREQIFEKAKKRYPAVSSISVEETYRGTDVSVLQVLGETADGKIVIYTGSYTENRNKQDTIDDFIDEYLSA